MRTLSLPKLAVAAMLIGFVTPALAEGTGNTSITIEQPWARATPSGATTGAAYMTIDNKSATADRLTIATPVARWVGSL
jgi:periplasmic copper chaperone A